jgi:hypothetical protein
MLMGYKMNKKGLLGICVVTTLLLSSCGSDGSDGLLLRNFANTGCKSYTRGDGEGEVLIDWFEYMEYKCLDDGFLSLKHVNATFNCAASNFNMQATISGNEIRINETTAESDVLANCVCLFDLSCEVGPLKEGEAYTVFVNQQGVGYDSFQFTYKKGTSGTEYFHRDLCETPW